MESVIEKIKEERKKKGFSHENMAHELNISQAAYSKIEKSETKLTLERLFEIAGILEVPVIELLDKNSKITYQQQEFYDNSVGHQEFQNLYQESKELLDIITKTKDEIIDKQQQEIEFLRKMLSEKK